MKTASFIIPTFREPDKIAVLLKSFGHITDCSIEIVIVNGNPGDATSVWLQQCGDHRVVELAGNSSLYWSGLVNVGLRYLRRQTEKPRWFFLMNADVQFSTDILQTFIEESNWLAPCQLAAITVARGRVLSSGVKVRSWFFTLNRHVLAGQLLTEVGKNRLIPVDFLPTRCVMFPYEALQNGGLVNENRLPHYSADYEFTARLGRLGYPAYVATNISVELDTQNTGEDVYNKPLGFRKRLASVFSIKSSSNPVFQSRFVKLVYPRYARPSACILYFIRSVMEIVAGGNVIKRCLPAHESGFSGR